MRVLLCGKKYITWKHRHKNEDAISLCEGVSVYVYVCLCESACVVSVCESACGLTVCICVAME